MNALYDRSTSINGTRVSRMNHEGAAYEGIAHEGSASYQICECRLTSMSPLGQKSRKVAHRSPAAWQRATRSHPGRRPNGMGCQQLGPPDRIEKDCRRRKLVTKISQQSSHSLRAYNRLIAQHNASSLTCRQSGVLTVCRFRCDR